MSVLMRVKLNLSKIDKSKIFEGKKGKYVDITIALNDEKDEYGNNVAAFMQDKGEDKNYLGNGRVVWADTPQFEDRLDEAKEQTEEMKKGLAEPDDDLPF